MKFRNKINNEVVDVIDSVLLYAYSHNSNWEKVEENELEVLTKAQLIERLAELGIEANDKQKKDELIKLIKETEEKEETNSEEEE